jgi:hypothetical protein
MVFSPPDSCSMSANGFPGGITLYRTPPRYGSYTSATSPNVQTNLALFHAHERVSTLLKGPALGEILVNVVDTTRNVLVCFHKELISFLLDLLELLIDSFGIVSSGSGLL